MLEAVRPNCFAARTERPAFIFPFEPNKRLVCFEERMKPYDLPIAAMAGCPAIVSSAGKSVR